MDDKWSEGDPIDDLKSWTQRAMENPGLNFDQLQQKIEELRAGAPPAAVALTTKLFPKGKTLKIPLADLARWIPELKDCRAVIFVINPETLSEIPVMVPEVAASLYSTPIINLDQGNE